MNPPPADTRRSRGRRLATAIGVLVAVAGGLYLSREWLFLRASHVLDVSEPPRRSDAVFVLGGGVNERPFVAAALYRAGLVGRVIHAGIDATVDSPDAEDGVRPPEHEITRRVLFARGVPADKIEKLPDSCRSTVDETHALAKYLAANPGVTVAVITHGFHTRRARALFRRALSEDANRIYFVAAPTDGFTADDWWRSEEGVETYATEYLKLALTGGW
jgi:uncharacterized SAM-binding protein YcdF (DUF218 family)